MATPARRHRWLVSVREELAAGVDLYDIEVEDEVRRRLETLADAEFAAVLRFAERLAVKGRELTEPYAKRLEHGVLELRPKPYQVTFWFPSDRRPAVLLTAFRKRADIERREKDPAYRAKTACEAHHPRRRPLPAVQLRGGARLPRHTRGRPPERLSRWLVLVKWWLLALPHYAVLGFLPGGA
ncbi:hypothetical protein GCM10009663_74200 [Kitasatospora arboriphila]|uniref:Type II toxin-antitoxin system RelE/ParE family toxin n=1 Tax=Kitasatospora arboriphila TaxID=258052 RepID=A0ABN1U6D0_9ACTN